MWTFSLKWGCSGGLWNFNSLFCECPSYFLRCTPPSSTFIESFVSFDYSFHKMFGHLLGPRSFDSLKGLSICKQTSFPIISGGVRFISTSIIALTTYLWNWALITLIIVTRFMVDQHPFLFEALAQVDNNTFPF